MRSTVRGATAAMVFAMVTVASSAARSTASAPVAIKNLFAFDVTTPTVKCVKVTGAVEAKLTERFTCAAPENPQASASGKTIVAECAAKKGTNHFMVFATKNDCEDERATQLANGE